MYYYVINVENTNITIITTNETEAIQIYDKLVDMFPEIGWFHYSTWKEEDPEGYDPNCSIEDFAAVCITVFKYNTLAEALEDIKEG